MTTTSKYPPSFFSANVQSSMGSARSILKIVFDMIKVDSIVDVGCGSGAWLATAESLGSTVLRGYDGPWADPAAYTSPNIDFVPVDLETTDIDLDRRFDLAMSVEVAEHLSDARSDTIVGWLCAASDVVLFGAAIPDQGGHHHINEQPQSYWVEKFRAQGFDAYDVIRPGLWNDGGIKYWFLQNTLIFVKTGSDAIDTGVLRAMEGSVYDAVHPRAYHNVCKTVRDTQAQLAAANKRVTQLEHKVSGMRPPLRKTRAKDLPGPLRPVLTTLWHALPAETRRNIRKRKR